MLDTTTIGGRIRAALEYSGLNNARLAEQTGVTIQAVGQWISTSRVGKNRLPLIAKATRVRLEWLLTGHGPMAWLELTDRPNGETGTAGHGILHGAVPLISWSEASAWAPDETNLSDEVRRMIACVAPHSGNAYALEVIGRSMTAPTGLSVPEGYIIVIDPDPRRAATQGDLVVARISDQQEIVFKQLAMEDGRICLRPLNPQHPPIFDTFEVLGKVIQVMLDID